jgi:surface protein
MKAVTLKTYVRTIQKLLTVTAIGLGAFVLCSQTAWASPITPGSFSIIVKTDNPGNTGPTEMSIYAFGVGYDYDAYWEEVGNDSNNGTSSSTGSMYLDFLTPGIYRIDITGDFPAFFLSGEAPKLLSVEQWGNIQWRTMERALYGAVNARINATDAPDLSQVTDMGSMFCQASSMNDSINHWDVSTVTDMGAMFAGATAFNQPLDNWDVSNVTNMGSEYCDESMFENATSFNQPLNDWDISSLTNLSSLFLGATAFNQPLDNWNIANISDMSDLFTGTALSIQNYSQTLASWSAQSPQSGVNLNADTEYCSTVQAARDTLTTTYGWVISDGGSTPCYTLSYAVGANATLIGNGTQTIIAGDDGASVEIVPDAGYVFTGWSDGSTDNPRTDSNVSADVTATAVLVAAETGGGSGTATRVGDRLKNQLNTTTSTPAVVTKESFLASLQTFIDYLKLKEEEINNLPPEESKKLIIAMRDIIVYLLTLLKI